MMCVSGCILGNTYVHARQQLWMAAVGVREWIRGYTCTYARVSSCVCVCVCVYLCVCGWGGLCERSRFPTAGLGWPQWPWHGLSFAPGWRSFYNSC